MSQEDNIAFISLASTAFLMAAIAGFTDVLSFVGVNHLFTAHITGNIVILISDIINHNIGVTSKIIAIPLFILFAGIMSYIIETSGKTSRILIGWFLLEIFFMFMFMWGGIQFIPYTAVNSFLYTLIGMFGVCAMAIHNTLLKTFMVTFPPCTVMTGNLTQFTIDFVGYFFHRKKAGSPEKRKKTMGALKRYGNVLLGFVTGGALGAIGYSSIGFWSVILPLLVLSLLVIKIKFEILDSASSRNDG